MSAAATLATLSAVPTSSRSRSGSSECASARPRLRRRIAAAPPETGARRDRFGIESTDARCSPASATGERAAADDLDRDYRDSRRIPRLRDPVTDAAGRCATLNASSGTCFRVAARESSRFPTSRYWRHRCRFWRGAGRVEGIALRVVRTAQHPISSPSATSRTSAARTTVRISNAGDGPCQAVSVLPQLAGFARCLPFRIAA